MSLAAFRSAQQALLASFPFISLGVVGIAFATFLLALGRINRAHLNLWVALGSAFVGGVFQAARIIQCDFSTASCIRPGLSIVQGIALGFFLNFKLLFLFRRIRQPGLYDPPTPNFPLPLSMQLSLVPSVTPTLTAKRALASTAAQRVGKWTVWVTILTTGLLDGTWRIGFVRNFESFVGVYRASHALQLILQLAFSAHLLFVMTRSPARPRIYVFYSYAPLLLGIHLGIIVVIVALASVGFVETPLGRLLLFLQMYIFLLETSLMDHKRPYRDSFSFERKSTPAPSINSGSDGQENPPALSRSPLDRAARAAEGPLRIPSALAHFTSSRQQGSGSSVASSGTGPVLRRSSHLPSWLPVLQWPDQEEVIIVDSIVDAAPLNRSNTVARPHMGETTFSGLLSAYRFPESVEGSGRSSEFPGRSAIANGSQGQRIREIALPSVPPSAASSSSVRRNRPTLTIDTSVVPRSSATAKAVQVSKPLPPPPPPAPRTNTLETTSSSTTLNSLFPLSLPAPLQNPTAPLALSKAPPGPASTAQLPPSQFRPPDDSNRTSTATRSYLSTTSENELGAASSSEALDQFPPPPAAALNRTQSGRTGTTISLGRLTIRNEGEFELEPPRRPFAAGQRGDSSESVWIGSVENYGGELEGGVDVTSLIVGSDCRKELLQGLGAAACGGIEEGKEAEAEEGVLKREEQEEPESPVAGGASPSPPSTDIIRFRPPPGLPSHPASSLPVLAKKPPPRPWPPAPTSSLSRAPAPPPVPAPAPVPKPQNDSISSISTLICRPPAPTPDTARRPSPVALAAARIRADDSLLPLPVPRSHPQPISSASTLGQQNPTGSNPGAEAGANGRMKRFVFPLSSSSPPSAVPPPRRPTNSSARGEAATSRIVVHPRTPFEYPRRVPEARGPKYSPSKASEGRATPDPKNKVNNGKLRNGNEGSEEAQLEEVVGVALTRETGKLSRTPSGRSR